MQRFGIDISKWQGDFNVTEAKNEGVQFAIIKIGGGDNSLYGDKKFEENYSKFKEAGIPIGCYFYGNAKTISEAKKEADYWMFLMDNHSFELPVFYDVEGSMLNNTPRVLTDIILTVCGTLYNSGYAVGSSMPLTRRRAVSRRSIVRLASAPNGSFAKSSRTRFVFRTIKWSGNTSIRSPSGRRRSTFSMPGSACPICPIGKRRGGS